MKIQAVKNRDNSKTVAGDKEDTKSKMRSEILFDEFDDTPKRLEQLLTDQQLYELRHNEPKVLAPSKIIPKTKLTEDELLGLIIRTNLRMKKEPCI